MPGDKLLWHYGLFHGIHTAPDFAMDSENGIIFDDGDDDEAKVDYNDDFRIAKALGKFINQDNGKKRAYDAQFAISSDDAVETPQAAKAKRKKVEAQIRREAKQFDEMDGCEAAVRARYAAKRIKFVKEDKKKAQQKEAAEKKEAARLAHQDKVRRQTQQNRIACLDCSGLATLPALWCDECREIKRQEFRAQRLALAQAQAQAHLQSETTSAPLPHPASASITSAPPANSAPPVDDPVPLSPLNLAPSSCGVVVDVARVLTQSAEPPASASLFVHCLRPPGHSGPGYGYDMHAQLPAQAVEATTTRQRGTDSDEERDDDIAEISSEGDDANLNESHLDMQCEQPMTRLELSTMAAEDIWALFNDKKCRGGQIARSVFIEAKKLEPQLCDPWVGLKSLAKRKAELVDQRSSFMQWAKNDQRVLTWIRTEVYKIVLRKPTTYRGLEVTHAELPITNVAGTSVIDGLTLEVLQATDDVMARVAHLPCTPEGRLALNLIFGAFVTVGDELTCVRYAIALCTCCRLHFYCAFY